MARGSVCSLIPRLPCSGTGRCIHGESWYLFSRDHDVIKIGPEVLERQRFACLCIQPSVCMIFAPQQLDMCSKLFATFALYPVLSVQVRPHTIKVSPPPFYIPWTLFTWQKIPGYSTAVRFKSLIWLVWLGLIKGNGAYAHIAVYSILTNRIRALKSTVG